MFEKFGPQKPHREYKIEGHIEVSEVSESTVFFHSKFESANLRQAFKVPLE